MELNKVIEILLKYENRYPVSSWKIGDFYIWPVIRIKIGNYLLSNKKKSIKKRMSKIHIIVFFKMMIDFIINLIILIFDLKNNKIDENTEEVIFLSNNYYRIKLNNVYVDRIISPFNNYFNELGHTTKVFESANKRFRIPRYDKTTLIDCRLIISNMRSDIIAKYKKNIDLELKNNHGLMELLDEPEIGLEYSILKRDLLRIINQKKIFVNQIQKLSPRAAFLVNYPTITSFAYIIACRELNIYTFEIQHGVQGPRHLSYSNWSDIPESGYDCLPDYFLVWSNYEANVINLWGNNRHRAIVVGNQFIPFWKNNINHKEYDCRIKEILSKHKSEDLILYSISNKLVPKFILDYFLKKPKLLLWIRMHPNRLNMRKKLERQLKLSGLKNIFIDDTLSFPLYSILPYVKLQITRYSSVIIEAKDYGIKSVVVDKWGEELYQSDIRAGDVYTAFSLNELEKIIPKITKLYNEIDVLLIERMKKLYNLIF